MNVDKILVALMCFVAIGGAYNVGYNIGYEEGYEEGCEEGYVEDLTIALNRL